MRIAFVHNNSLQWHLKQSTFKFESRHVKDAEPTEPKDTGLSPHEIAVEDRTLYGTEDSEISHIRVTLGCRHLIC